MSGLLVRWLGGALLALPVSLAGLELSVCLAGARERALAPTRTGLVSAVIDDADASLTPWLTR